MLGRFFGHRVLKILPLYVFWSAVFAILFYLVPAWSPATEQPNFLWQLLLGRADYHLYFVPMIFQLYLIFPLILQFFKKCPGMTLVVAVAVQLIWWWFFSYGDLTVTSWKYFAGDGEQYLWMTNWIAYFVLGMYLPKVWAWFDKSKFWFGMFFVAWMVSGGYAVFNALQAINSGIDPLFALKFTRYPLFVYSFVSIAVASYLVARFFVVSKFNMRSSKIARLFIKLGEVSYPLYLGHTLVLRVVFWLVYSN